MMWKISSKNLPFLILIVLLCIFLLNACAKRAKEEGVTGSVEAYYQRGRDLFFEKSDFDGAYEELRKVVEIDPEFDGPYLNFMLGYIYEDRHLYNKAIYKYLKELELNKGEDPEDLRVRRFTLLYLAEAFSKAGALYKALYNNALNGNLNYYNARLYLKERVGIGGLGQEGLILKPERVGYLHFFRGLVYYQLGRIDSAISDLERIDSKSDLYLRSQIILARALYKKGDVQKAKGIWKAVSGRAQKDPLIMSELGYTWADLGIEEKAKDAVEYCQESYNLLSEREDLSAKNIAKKNLSWAYFKNGNIDKAFELVEDFDPTLPESVDSWGEYNDPVGKISIKYTTKFYDPSILKHKVDIYLGMALKYYKEYMKAEAGQDIEEVLCQIGVTQLRLGMLDEAIATLKEIISSDDASQNIKTKASINLGTAYYLNGMKREAFDLWEQVEENNSEPFAMNELGYTYARLGIRLKDTFKKYRQGDVESPGALSRNLGLLYFKRGLNTRNIADFSEAIRYLEKNHRQEWEYDIEKNDPILLLDLANAYYNRRFFGVPPQILVRFRDEYPEVEQAFNAYQASSEIWHSIKWDKDLGWDIQWHDLWF